MWLIDARREAINRHEFGCPPATPFRRIAGFLKNLVEGAEVLTRGQESAHSVANVGAGLVVRCTAARKVQGWNVGNIGIAFLEDVRIEGRIP
ncbi:MAG: hypothetical protein ABSH24_31720 [Bryobacteraceae bacterium]|jgi:hypothetical protein